MSEIEDKFSCDIEERNKAKRDLKKRFCLKQILGKSKVVKELHKKIDMLYSCDASVLITGESGTGKELVARALHYSGNRSEKSFIPVNCSAIPENLIENEFFGHVKGAFTGAHSQQTGLVKEAEGGTIFLDEIGTISPYVQVKFLRLLQNGEYKPLGDTNIHKADIRIIAATNSLLKNLANDGTFREDLFYRLNIVSLHIPPLRERREDIPILVEHFIHKYSMKYKKTVKEISKDAIDALISMEWPGNIRELENKVQQLIIMSESSVINFENIRPVVRGSRNKDCEIRCFKIAKKKAINVFEKNYLDRLLMEHRGNVASAAKTSGQNRTALWNLLKKHNISPKSSY